MLGTADLTGGPRRGGAASCRSARRLPLWVSPMLARSSRGIPVELADWAIEPKWDGWRCLARIDGDSVRLSSRWRNDVTAMFPDLGEPPGELAGRRVLLDGEIVALRQDGSQDFHMLMGRRSSRAGSRSCASTRCTSTGATSSASRMPCAGERSSSSDSNRVLADYAVAARRRRRGALPLHARPRLGRHRRQAHRLAVPPRSSRRVVAQGEAPARTRPPSRPLRMDASRAHLPRAPHRIQRGAARWSRRTFGGGFQSGTAFLPPLPVRLGINSPRAG